MLSYCLNCKKKTESKHPTIEKIKIGRIMLSSNCPVCGSKKCRFIEQQKVRGLLSSLGIRKCNFFNRSSFDLGVLIS